MKKTLFCVLLSVIVIGFHCSYGNSLNADIEMCCIPWTRACSDPAVTNQCSGDCDFLPPNHVCGDFVWFANNFYNWVRPAPLDEIGQERAITAASKLCGAVFSCKCFFDPVAGNTCDDTFANRRDWIQSQLMPNGDACIGDGPPEA